MRIICSIKQVPESGDVRLDERTGAMIRQGVEAIVNPLDLYAIEAALRLRQAHGGRVTAISMGPAQAQAALREALAMGVDEAVLLSDAAFAGSDTWATSLVLAEALRKLGPFDLVICGERATDGDTGQVPPAMAAMLDLPVATYAQSIEFDGQAGCCRVQRLLEDGCELLEVATPAVITVVKAIAQPRLPTLRLKQHSRRVEIPVWTADDMCLDHQAVGLAGSPTRVVKVFRPTIARKCRMLTARDEQTITQAADEFVALLRQRGLR